ncbi:hypothetical protein ACRALDRAFT_1073811 [Sodiomyces alcalophilus JCM 7366]|uniref:uncharacterized protein n=1 Tax=Sodiomyces alcalophilus JCM 7366 TaxID=591952 RepID=UPI0039B41F90
MPTIIPELPFKTTWADAPSSNDPRHAPRPLTEEQKQHFLTHGWVRIPDCFTKEQADWVVQDVWTRLGSDPNDKSTWRGKTNMPSHRSFDASILAPKAWSAITELCGGEDKLVDVSRQWRDGLIVSLGTAENEGKDTDPRDLDNWHVDGDFFVHYLDSPEQALLVIPLFSDIGPGGGGTMLCPAGMQRIAKHLYDHPQGVSPSMMPRDHPDFDKEVGLRFYFDMVKSLDRKDFVEVTGKVGDVFLLHPFMVHSASTNPRRQLRIITNPPVHFNEPQSFNRPDGKYSLVERTTMRALGKDSLPEWKIGGPRERRIPARYKALAEMREKERRRLEEVSVDVSST